MRHGGKHAPEPSPQGKNERTREDALGVAVELRLDKEGRLDRPVVVDVFHDVGFRAQSVPASVDVGFKTTSAAMRTVPDQAAETRKIGARAHTQCVHGTQHHE